tara:strand:- start:95 stop:787 length:693 start_codon:yes stop_codon:yes gene_type:complete
MKKLIIKYSIEFFVIVFSISVSFFVENLREENEKDNQRIIVKQSLIQELKSAEAYLRYRNRAFEEDLKAVELILNKDATLDSVFSNVSSGGFSNPFIVSRNFNPPSSVYKSLINDGRINLIKSQKLKSLIEDTYVYYTEFIHAWQDDDEKIASIIEMQIIENHTSFYMKDIFTGEDIGIMLEFYEMVQKDSKLKAYLKAKTVPMSVKMNTLEGYMESRKNLISALEESLD